MFFLTGVARYLFVPLAEAVVFAMLASYILSRTLVPTLAMYLLKAHDHTEHRTRNPFILLERAFERGFEQLRLTISCLLTAFRLSPLDFYSRLSLALCVCTSILLPWLGQDFFPVGRHRTDPPALRAHDGHAHRGDSEPRATRRSGHPPYDSCRRTGQIVDNIGLPYSGINTTYSNAAPDRPGRRATSSSR